MMLYVVQSTQRRVGMSPKMLHLTPALCIRWRLPTAVDGRLKYHVNSCGVFTVGVGVVSDLGL